MADKKRILAEILGDPDGAKGPEAKGPDALHACAEEFIECMHTKDVEGVVSAFKAIFEELEKEPHDEVDHE